MAQLASIKNVKACWCAGLCGELDGFGGDAPRAMAFVQCSTLRLSTVEEPILIVGGLASPHAPRQAAATARTASMEGGFGFAAREPDARSRGLRRIAGFRAQAR